MTRNCSFIIKLFLITAEVHDEGDRKVEEDLSEVIHVVNEPEGFDELDVEDEDDGIKEDDENHNTKKLKNGKLKQHDRKNDPVNLIIVLHFQLKFF